MIRWRALCDSEWYRSGGIIAKLAISFATAVWAAIVTYKAWGESSAMVPGTLLILSLTYLLWFVLHLRPPPFWMAWFGYAAMLYVWGRALVVILWYDQPPQREDAIACISAVTILGIFALVAGHKHGAH